MCSCPSSMPGPGTSRRSLEARPVSHPLETCSDMGMNKRVEALMEGARKLSAGEREELLLRLVRARDDDEPAEGTPEEIEAAWADEIEHRIAADERGEVELISHDVVMARLRSRPVRK